jgi:hypothetical protein
LRAVSFVALSLAIAAGSRALASEPSAATLRSAFEAQFPKAEASAAALQLERLAAPLGIELAPKEEAGPRPLEAAPTNASGEASAPAFNGRERRRPSAEESAGYQRISEAVFGFLDRELKDPGERIGAPSQDLERSLEERQDALVSIESVLLREADVHWESDVSRGYASPLPNLPGHLRLQRLIIARALLEARRGETDGALQTLEASWRLNQTLSSRPEMICQLIVVAVAELEVGALRKLDTPAYGWADRFRDGKLFSAYFAAFQNQAWFNPDVTDLTGEEGAFGRALRQVAEEFPKRDLCAWTPETLRDTLSRAVRDQFSEDDPMAELVMPNLLGGFTRLRRLLVDAELTALVLDARAERAASRKHAWPDKLLGVGAGVCPDGGWSYHPSGKGTALFAFEGRLVEEPSASFRIPLTFTAGVPTPPHPKADTTKDGRRYGTTVKGTTAPVFSQAIAIAPLLSVMFTKPIVN